MTWEDCVTNSHSVCVAGYGKEGDNIETERNIIQDLAINTVGFSDRIMNDVYSPVVGQ